MDKIWKPTGKKSDKLIIIHDNYIYKGSPDDRIMNRLTVETEEAKNEILKSLYRIPFHYVQKVVNQRGIHYIKFFLGKDSEEEVFVEDETVKDEIFEYLKSEFSSFRYTSKIPDAFTYVRPKIIGIVVLTAIFLWASYFAIQMEQGYEYGAARGITGIAIGLGTLGIVKLLIGYIVILGLTIFSLVKKLETRSQIQTLKR
ncbi:hypothetical protein [Kordia sp.]|uniref:hypothetical protein n=1 Tax=Kordia sp. TaxID=1965332 RepID=UPI003D2C6BBE